MSTSFRDYDLALMAKLGATVTTPALPALPYYAAAVPGITALVRIEGSLPEEWYVNYTLPGIAIVRIAEMGDPSRALPGFLPTVVSADPAHPDTIETATSRPQAINLLYQIHVAAESQVQYNALLEHLLFRLPKLGYGSALTVYGSLMAMRSTGHRDMTDDNGKGGRVFRRVEMYTVEGWMASTDVTYAGWIKHIRGKLDVQHSDVVFVEPIADPPEAESIILFAADAVD